MVIHTVRVRNFRCYASRPGGDWGVIFRPVAGLNLIIGPNGSGKTALVDAIDLVLNYEGRSNRSLLSEYDFPDGDVDRKMEIEVTLTDLGQALPAFEADVQWIDPQDGVPVERKGVEPDDTVHVRAVIISFLAGLDADDGELKWRWVLPKTLATEMHEQRELTRSQHESLGYFRVRPAITAGAFTLGDYSALGRHLRKLQYRLGKLPARLRPRTEMPACYMEGLTCDSCPQVSECSPDASGGVRTENGGSTATVGKVIEGLVSYAKGVLGPRHWIGKRTTLGPRYGGLQASLAALTIGVCGESAPTSFVPFDRLSAGERYALSFAIASAQVPGDLPPVIVAEEPETALHPSAVAKVVSGLQTRREGGAPQVIMTSHAESVLRCFSPEHVFAMDLDRTPTLVGDVMQRHWPSSIVKQQMPYVVECLIMPGAAGALFCDKVLLVEGAGDAVTAGKLGRIAARASSSANKPKSFADLGWAVLSAHASSQIADFVKLLIGLGKQVAVLLDGDDPGKKTAEKIKQVVPTFLYTSTAEGLPVLEDALLLGLPTTLQHSAMDRFYAFPVCATCPKNARQHKCWHARKCEFPEQRPLHKVDLQDICLSLYEESNSYPPAFRVLGSCLDTATAGSLHTVQIDAPVS